MTIIIIVIYSVVPEICDQSASNDWVLAYTYIQFIDVLI